MNVVETGVDKTGMGETGADQPSATLLPYPDTDERRLRRALRQLDAALSDQRRAVAGFRAQIGALDGAVASLAARAQGLRDSLAAAAADTARAQAASHELQGTADRLDSLARS